MLRFGWIRRFLPGGPAAAGADSPSQTAPVKPGPPLAAARLVQQAWTGGNVIVSPTDLSGALALLALAAAGNTRRELTQACGLPDRWVTPFESAQTRPAEFHTPIGPRTVSTMHRTGRLAYAEDERYQMMEIPFDSGFGLVVVLPRETSGLAALWQALTNPGGNLLPTGSLVAREVSLSLPRFEVRAELDVKEALKALGVRDAFEDADFTPVSQARPAGIEWIQHHAAIRVHERGAEAAAVTVAAALILGRGSESVSMVVNRPFLFLLRHHSTGELLFCGVVVDPAPEGVRGRGGAA